MRSIDELLRDRFEVAIGLAFGIENVVDPLIKTGDPKFADYQSNVAMSLGKHVGLPPREVATRIIGSLSIDDICETPVIAGPGFINLRLKKSFLAAALVESFTESPRAGVELSQTPQTVVVDYSAPNVAKQLAVHHIRSTILGDAIARTLEFLGHTVIRQNHIGDFGTQFGMLIHHLRSIGHGDDHSFTIEDLDRYYKEATAKFKTDPAFAEQARKTVVELQSGNESAVALWNKMRVATHIHYTQIYDLLNVTLTDDHERGESFFGSRLPKIVEHVKGTLETGGEGPLVSAHAGTVDEADSPIGHESPDLTDELPDTEDAVHRVTESQETITITKPYAAYSDGAFCIFLPGYLDREKNPLPLMLQKRDGGYPYSATDMAALYFRVQEEKNTPAEQMPLRKNWHADRVIYFTNAPQSLHFAMLFDAFRAAQWDRNPANGAKVSLEHAAFGSLLGEDNKIFKTRFGEAPKLLSLLHEAIERAGKVDAERGAQLSPEKRAAVSRAVGIGAVKYADLRQDRLTDYVFAWDRMLSLEGNTGPYLQMQYTRIASIYRRGEITPAQVVAAKPSLMLDHEQEAALAKKLLQFGSVVEYVARDLKPHLLCTYLYELCGAFSRFFENCPVLKAGTDELKMSRLLLCNMVATVLRIGLQDLLGIEVLEEM